MRKYILTIAFILIFTVSFIGLPLAALALDEVSFGETTDIYLSGTGYTFQVIAGSVCDEMVVGSTYITFTMSAGSGIELHSTDRLALDNTLSDATRCFASYSGLSLPPQDSQTDVTVTPSTTGACSAVVSGGGGGVSGGGGGSRVVSSIPSSATGQVNVNASYGGNTILTTDENTTAKADVPAYAVSTTTTVKITSETKADVIEFRPVPSEKSIVGGYVYDYTATSMADGAAVTTFSKDITVTLSYTDEQITGLNEETLKIYYWDGTQWLVLTSTVDKTNNKVSAITDHFTYFVIMGGSEAPSEMAKPEDYGLSEGDLISAEGDFDIFIINQYGYKRLFLNPVIFEMYGHLGSWEDVKTVTIETRDAFVTSTHYRYVNEDNVYHLEITGEDTGILQWIRMTGEDFLAQGGVVNAIFTINKNELDWYSQGAHLLFL